MTYVQTAVFTVEADYQEQFAQKIKNDVTSLKAWDGNISAEGWQGDEQDGKVDFILMSKWANKDDFEAWLNRPEHAERHQRPEVKEVRKHVTRKVASYQILAD